MRPSTLALAGAVAGTANAIVRGVNLGGWLVTEPWMTPTLFNSTGAVDEWHLCNDLGPTDCLSTLESHWSTFYTRDDFVAMKYVGLNAVRIPLGYWAVVDLIDGEPYVAGQYPYLIQAVQWANEMGFTVLIDVHGAPGSQNGWEETGLVGPIAFPDNTSNSDRTLQVLTNLTTEFTKSEYGGVVTNIELLNEPIFAVDLLKDFYTEGANVVGVANGSGVNVTIHDAFYNPPYWANYNPWDADATTPAEYVTLDTHQFWGFAPLNNLTEPEILERVCEFGVELKDNSSDLLYTLVAEWSLDSGATANTTAAEGEYQAKRTWFRKLFEAQNAAYTPNGAGQASIGWYYWAWKTEYDIDTWSYRKGVADGYIPSNVSDASTYVFPILDNGCIDQNFTYNAPATISSVTVTPTGTATSTSTPSSALADGSASTTTSKSFATAHAGHPALALQPWLAVAPVLLYGIA